MCWRDESASSLNTRGDVSKKIPNLLILRNNYELKSIVVNYDYEKKKTVELHNQKEST